MSKPLKIGVIAGEASGDVLGGGLLKELKRLYPDAQIEGIGGKHMIDNGLKSLADMNILSVMGLVEVLKHLPSLLKLRRFIVQHFLNNPPDIFIGIDAPDFNLPIEKKLKASGVKTVHYVSPTVWAWREKRIHKIAKATNLVLGIFPFESVSYEKYGYPYTFVGHTLADDIPIEVDKAAARKKLGLKDEQHVLAVLPGSRRKEIDSLLQIFLDTARLYNKTKPCCVLIPSANMMLHKKIESIVQAQSFDFDVQIYAKPARELMIAADLVLLTSGTASLEAMLCKRPMVVAYKMSALTYKMMQRLYIPKYFALPNILAEEQLVPEVLQEEVNPASLCQLLLEQLASMEQNIDKFISIHRTLQCNANEQAAQAVLSLVKQ
ncbi:lipid-A-disaccharide synthase [Agaribacter flavus]|uniref:Lipid-A-disaccharide synthase n=1 Tax=Agaribacter flavus TaxID=1902781 RepID=A0ABV7FSU0_9ALTE